MKPMKLPWKVSWWKWTGKDYIPEYMRFRDEPAARAVYEAIEVYMECPQVDLYCDTVLVERKDAWDSAERV